MSEEKGRSDEVVANEYWDAFLARNRSIIVDLMYGQLKSTVTCLKCNNVSITFDPFLSIALPIQKTVEFELVYVPFNIHTHNKETDEYTVQPMPLYTFPLPKNCSIRDAKEILKGKLGLNTSLDNMVVANQNKGIIAERLSDDLKCDAIDQERALTTVYEVPTEGMKAPVVAELTFFKNVKKNKKTITDRVDGAIPRLFPLESNWTIMEVKKQLAQHLKHIYEEEFESDEQINKLIEVYVRDNNPMIQKGKYTRQKAECEFCKDVHTSREVFCDLTLDKVNGNTFEGAQ